MTTQIQNQTKLLNASNASSEAASVNKQAVKLPSPDPFQKQKEEIASTQKRLGEEEKLLRTSIKHGQDDIQGLAKETGAGSALCRWTDDLTGQTRTLDRDQANEVALQEKRLLKLKSLKETEGQLSKLNNLYKEAQRFSVEGKRDQANSCIKEAQKQYESIIGKAGEQNARLSREETKGYIANAQGVSAAYERAQDSAGKYAVAAAAAPVAAAGVGAALVAAPVVVGALATGGSGITLGTAGAVAGKAAIVGAVSGVTQATVQGYLNVQKGNTNVKGALKEGVHIVGKNLAAAESSAVTTVATAGLVNSQLANGLSKGMKLTGVMGSTALGGSAGSVANHGAQIVMGDEELSLSTLKNIGYDTALSAGGGIIGTVAQAAKGANPGMVRQGVALAGQTVADVCFGTGVGATRAYSEGRDYSLTEALVNMPAVVVGNVAGLTQTAKVGPIGNPMKRAYEVAVGGQAFGDKLIVRPSSQRGVWTMHLDPGGDIRQATRELLGPNVTNVLKNNRIEGHSPAAQAERVAYSIQKQLKRANIDANVTVTPMKPSLYESFSYWTARQISKISGKPLEQAGQWKK